ncbi:chitobiase/beta-hexosaminidase C-terminal domain-containing protein, partial [Oscillibacter sp.]|uniref:chitobiase/beta-hexosaminidase C-terminal domain-containing protein n=1 Tax=Oscillibacter sp. TaxID=1945593 RepID=UPI0028967FA3
AGADNAIVTGDVAVHVTAADIGDSATICGQYNSNVDGDVSVTVNGGNLFSCGDVYGSSGGSVTGKVTVKTNGKVSANLLGSKGGSVGAVEVTTGGDVTGSVTGLSDGSAGAVTVTANHNVTDAVCAVLDGSVTGDVSLAVNAQAKSVSAVKAASAVASVVGNVTFTMGENASLTDNTVTVLATVLSASDSIKATVTGDVTFNHQMNTLADAVILSDRDEYSVISGASSMNVYKDNGQQIVLRGGNTGGVVNLFTLYTKPVYVPVDGAAPVFDSSVTGGYFVKKTSDQSGFDLYALVNLTAPIVDDANKRILGNGFPLKVSSAGVSYDCGAGWQSVATGDLSAYTVYGGAEQTDVQDSSITFSGVSAQSPGTYFGGGMSGDVTGNISIKLEGSSAISTDFGRPVTIYGGAENADVTGNLNVSLNYDEKSSSTNMVTWFAGCKNGDFNGSAQFDIQRDDTYERDEDDTSGKAFNVFKLPGAFNLCSENGTFTGKIDFYTGAMDYRTDITGGIRDAYNTTGKSSGYNTIHLLSYTDSTATPITRTSEKTTVTGEGDPNLKSISWDNGTAVLSYHVVLYIIDEYTAAAQITDTAEHYILYAAGGLYCDRGTIGEEDNADILVRGFATQYLHYYFGTENAKLGVGEALTFTMDKAAWVYFYMNRPLTLNLNTSLTGGGYNGVVIGDTAESVLLTIGRVDGGTESYTINSSGLWYSKLLINKPFDSNYGIPIKSGNNYSEDDITLNLDKSKYATEKYIGTFGGTYCRLKDVSTVVTEPEEDFIGRISEGGSKLEGYVLIFADGGKNYAAVDTDKDGELDDSEKDTKVEITDYYPEALPNSHIAMLGGSLDFFHFYGETFTQKGGSINTIFYVYPASESATILQDAGCTLDYLTIKSASETKDYTANPTCVINVEIGGYIKSINSSTAAANIKLLSTADPGSDGTFTFSKNDTFGTLDFSDYTLKYLDSTNGYYTDISYYNEKQSIKPQTPSDLKIVADGDNYRYCPDTTTGAMDIVNVKADFGSVSYGYDASALAVTLDLSTMCPNMYDGLCLSSDFVLTCDKASGKVTVKPESGLEPGIHQGICNISYYISGTSQTLKFPVSITVLPQTVTVTPSDDLITYSGSGNTGWKRGYTLSPDVTLVDADKDLLVYYGEATAGAHELHLSKTRSSDNRYNFVLATGKTYNLTISAYNGDQGYPIESAVATAPNTWGSYALITAPEGYLVSLAESGTYTKSVKWNTSSTKPQDGITYYIKDNTEGSDSYLLTLQKTIDGVKVCTDGDLVNYAAGTVTPAATSADVAFSAALKDSTAGACGINETYVLAVPTGEAVPTVDTVLASGTAAIMNGGAYAVAITGLNANTAYTFYAAHTTEAGVKASAAATVGSVTTGGLTPIVITAPSASGVYGTALTELPFTGGKVTGQNGTTLSGSWTWTQTDAGIIYPTVNDTTAYEATFTPGDTQYSPVTVQLKPTMMPAQISVTGAAVQGRSYENDNTSVNITGVTFSDGVSLSLGTDYTAAGVMTDDNAGENKAVTVTLTMKNGNYTLSSNTSASTVSISKAEPVTLTDQSISRRCNLTGQQTISVSGLMPDDAGTLTYTKGTEGGDTAIISDWSAGADGTVKYTLSGGNIGDSVTLPVKINSTNYAESTVNVVITLTNKENQAAPAAFSLLFSLNADEATYTATIPAVPGAEYSFNGTDWSDTNTKSNIAPNESVTGCIRMKATDDKNASDITSSTKTAQLLTVKTPLASPNGGSFSGTQTVTLTCPTAGAEVYYTTDGSTPTSGSTKYTASFTISDTTTVKAIAVKDGMNSSAVLTVTFTKYSGGGTSGGGATVTTPGITVPVSTGKGHVEAKASVKDNTAIVSMTDAQIKEIATGAETTGTMKIDVSGLEVEAVIIPANVVTAANDTSGSTGLAVALPTGTVTLDKAALASVVGKGDIKFSVETVDNEKLTEPQKSALGNQSSTALVVDVNVFVNGTQTSTFGDGRTTVSVPYTPKSGENTDSITVWFIKDDGTIEPKNGTYANGNVTFTTEHLSQYLIVSFPFADVAEDAWYYGSVAYAYNNVLFAGTGAATFSPETSMTRQMIWMVLARMDGKMPADMDAARDWAIENGISDGTNPTNSITREQMATILYRYAQYKGYDITQGGMAIREFTDYDSVSEYALPALAWTVNAGLMQGSNNNIMPSSSATRAQVATILQRFCQNVAG